MWPSWSGHVDPSIGVRYQVEYKLSDYHGGNESGVWRPGPVVEHAGYAQQAATVLDLQRNSFYEFRVLPILRVGGQDVRGIVSPQSGPFRTKCHGAFSFQPVVDARSVALVLLTTLKILVQEKITQTSRANSECKHSKIERFSTLNERVITLWLQHHSSILQSISVYHSSSLFRFQKLLQSISVSKT